MRSAAFALLAIGASFLVGLSCAGTKVVTKTETVTLPGEVIYVDKPGPVQPADTTELRAQLAAAQKELTDAKAKAAADYKALENASLQAMEQLRRSQARATDCAPQPATYQRRGLFGRGR